MKTLQCREHGGTFKVMPRRGRPPVRCTSDNVCSRFPGSSDTISEFVPAEDKPVLERARNKMRTRKREKLSPEASMDRNRSVLPAQAAKARLEPLGWLCKGRAWMEGPSDDGDPGGQMMAEVMATRDGELIILRWQEGLVIQQEYILWDEKPSANGKPSHQLTFDPDECTDRELVRALSGMKVTWWNALGQKEESGVVDATKIEVVHCYNGVGDETPGDRIIKFSDHAGTGFRAFRVAALLKVG